MPNILRSAGNQTVEFDQLLECNTKNIFREKSFAKCGRETSPRAFSEKLKLGISLDQQSKVLYSFFIVWQIEGYRNILKLSC